MQRSRVNMTKAQLTARLSAHQPPNTSPKDHTEGSNPFVETTVPLTTVEWEGNGNRDMAPGLTRSLPKGPEQQDPPPSNLTQRLAQADFPFPCLQILTSPTSGTATLLQFFVQNWKQITQDSRTLQTIQGYKIPFCRRPRQRRMRVTREKCNSDAHHMEMAIKDLLAKGTVWEVKPQDDQSTSTLFLIQKKMAIIDSSSTSVP